MTARVYFLLDQDRQQLKVGVSSTPERRLQELATGNADRLKLLGHVPGTRQLEAQCHRVLQHWRTRGEWFSYGQQVRSFVATALTFGISAAFADISRINLRLEELEEARTRRLHRAIGDLRARSAPTVRELERLLRAAGCSRATATRLASQAKDHTA